MEVARLGHCLVVAAQEARTLSFFDLRAAGFPLVARWDLSAAGAAIGNIRALSVDPDSGTVWLRSPYHGRVPDGVAGVTMAIDPDGATFRACTGGRAPSAPNGARDRAA